MASSFTSFTALLTCHLLSEAFPDHHYMLYFFFYQLSPLECLLREGGALCFAYHYPEPHPFLLNIH